MKDGVVLYRGQVLASFKGSIPAGTYAASYHCIKDAISGKDVYINVINVRLSYAKCYSNDYILCEAWAELKDNKMLFIHDQNI